MAGPTTGAVGGAGAVAAQPDPIEALLTAAALFRTLALGFAFPGAGHTQEMRRALARLCPAARNSRMPPRLAAGIAEARRSWAMAGSGAVNAEYVRLFHGSGPVSLHETSYGDGRRLGGRAVEIADIAGFYRAFGFTIAGADPDLPDHLGAELEFASLLLLREGHAVSSGWPSRARLTRAAAKSFFADHLGRWTRPFERALSRAAAAPVYLTLGRLVEEAVAAQCRRLRARAAPVAGRQSVSDPMQEDTLGCPLVGSPRNGCGADRRLDA